MYQSNPHTDHPYTYYGLNPVKTTSDVLDRRDPWNYLTTTPGRLFHPLPPVTDINFGPDRSPEVEESWGRSHRSFVMTLHGRTRDESLRRKELGPRVTSHGPWR